MKGGTIEIVNTDAEGRLVLADMPWYAKERFNPKAILDLATLTGAAIVGLGHENAAVVSNNDAFCDAFLEAANSEGQGAWRMPLGKAYDALIKSSIGDIKKWWAGCEYDHYCAAVEAFCKTRNTMGTR